MATVRDIAKEAGVSVGTASRAITGNGYVAEETKALVWETAKRLGYVPKERTRHVGSSKAVGIVLPDISFPFWGTFLKYAEIELGNRGYKTFVCNSLGVRNRVNDVLDLLEKHELDGLIVNADVTDKEIARMEKLPVVSFECMLGNKIPMVSSEHRQGGRLAGQVLADSGCKHVLIVGTRHLNTLYGDYRIQECQKVLEEHGIEVTVTELDGSMISIRYCPDVVAEYMSIYSQVDGVFSDDIFAYCYVAEALRREIRIPEQLKVIGYDGNEITQVSIPRITTIVQDVPLLAHNCIEVLLHRIAGETVQKETLIPVKYKKGGTV